MTGVCHTTFKMFAGVRTFLCHIFSGERLQLFADDGHQLLFLWSSPDIESSWTLAEVNLPMTSAQYSLVFHARYVRTCPNSFGIDDIVFHTCTVGEQNRIKISLIQCALLKNLHVTIS